MAYGRDVVHWVEVTAVRLRARDPQAERMPIVRAGVALRGLAFIALAIAAVAVAVRVSELSVVLLADAVLVVLMAWCFQGIWLEHLVRSPGPILVRELSVTADVPDVDVVQLSAAFRRRLTKLRLRAPTPAPGSIPEQDFLETLASGRLDSKDPLVSSVSILRAALPISAYEVSAALVERRSAPDGLRWGVTAQVRLPHEVIPVDTAWASSPRVAVERAADIVTAAVLPRTRLGNLPPWSGWRGYTMPSLLVHHFERAEWFTYQRRYDEALDSYFAALELDPKSVDIRLHLGYVQEKLGLYLDAVATYAAARKMADDTSRALYGLRALRNRRASGRIASYRLAVLLGGRNVAHQWRKPKKAKTGSEAEHVKSRVQQRVRLRDCLTPEVIDMLKAHNLIIERQPIGARARAWLAQRAPAEPPAPQHAGMRGPPPWHEEEIKDLLKGLAPLEATNDEHDLDYYPLRNLLGHLAVKELVKVRRQGRLPGTSRALLAPLTVKLTMGCLDLRLGWVKHKLERTDEPWDPKVEERIRRSALRSRLRLAEPPFRNWAQHYNAATLCALPLLVSEAFDGASRPKLARRAVKHLACAVCRTTSQDVANRRDWLLSEDPDLNKLRFRREFKHFEVIHFPSGSRTPHRPTEIRRWEQSRYANELLIQTARRWETAWHERRDNLLGRTDSHVTLDWFVHEADAWAMVKKVTCNYRHWRARYELIEQMNQWSVKYAFEPLEVAVPSFASVKDATAVDTDSHTDEAADDAGNGTEHEITFNHDRLTKVNGSIPAMDAGTHPSAPILELQTELRDRDFWNRQPPRLYLASVCDVHAAMWQRLHEWLEAEPSAREAAKDAFDSAMKEEKHLRSTSSGLWMLWVAERRLLPVGWHDPLRAFRRNGTRSYEGAPAGT